MKDECLKKEKERLIASFFRIRGNEQVTKLQFCKAQCEEFLLKDDDSEIRDLINIICALIIYFETGNKEEARKHLIGLWYKLYPKPEFSLLEIRFLNCILFIELNIEKVIEIAEDCLIQMEKFKFHEDYMKIKLALNLNLLILLMDVKFFDSQYKFDELISQTIEEIIGLNLESQLNNGYYVAYANIYKGIFLNDRSILYTGLLLLKFSYPRDKHSLQELIKVFAKKYNIVINRLITD